MQVGTSTLTTFAVSGLIPQHFYTTKVRAFDAVGNLGSFSNSYALLMPPSDVEPPSDVTGMVITAIDFQSLLASWYPGTDNVGVVSTSLEQCTDPDCTDFRLVAKVSGGVSVVLSALAPQTTYRFRAKHSDAVGNVSLNYSTIVFGTTSAVTVGTVTGICRCEHHR